MLVESGSNFAVATRPAARISTVCSCVDGSRRVVSSYEFSRQSEIRFAYGHGFSNLWLRAFCGFALRDQGYDFLFRSSSLEYLVPCKVNWSARPFLVIS